MLNALWSQCTAGGITWILDVDISKFFDTLDQMHLRAFLQHRVRDGVITRLIGKWLNAGVLEQDVLHYPEAGTPQGGSISPLLSNVYLHSALDQWFAQEVQPRLRGRAFMLRFADDAVMGFERHEDAEKVCRVLPKRFGKYGLTLHPDKTRLVSFGRPSGITEQKSETFDFLGFTHYWGQSRRGQWIIRRKTARQRLSRGLQRIAEWCRHNRHRPIAEQHQELCQKVRGHYAYYGITGNALWLRKYREGVKKVWQKWLQRRSRSSTNMPWDRFTRVLQRYRLPPIRIVHSIYVAKPLYRGTGCVNRTRPGLWGSRSGNLRLYPEYRAYVARALRPSDTERGFALVWQRHDNKYTCATHDDHDLIFSRYRGVCRDGQGRG